MIFYPPVLLSLNSSQRMCATWLSALEIRLDLCFVTLFPFESIAKQGFPLCLECNMTPDPNIWPLLIQIACRLFVSNDDEWLHSKYFYSTHAVSKAN